MLRGLVLATVLTVVFATSFEQLALQTKGVKDPTVLAARLSASACKGDIDAHTYDLSNLAQYGDVSGDFIGYTWLFSFCDHVRSSAACLETTNGNSCQVYKDGSSKVHSTSSWDQPITWAKRTDGVDGIKLSLTGGDGTDTKRSADLYLKCDKTRTGAPLFTDVRDNFPNYEYYMDSANACSDYTPPAGGGSSSKGLSGGWIFIIILLCVIPVYIVAGCIIKRRGGASGMDSCPNWGFWKVIPGFALGGCKWTFTKMTSCCRKGEYDDITTKS
eukprot:TRINITY_DN10184_c0_g1_i1.p1 TRINITY_DN10184_c0_g1~~TRINITY_DN10184_c0_g1_i1.p1  ORF type:complete len:273 (+),score=53.16 TRINITY_DN10184_c0_g1_i1:42-860(+)